MSNDYENKILSAVDILIDNAVSKLNFDKTIEGTIYQIIDAGAGEYKVKYQDSVFTAYSESKDVYKVGTSVYVTIPGNDVTKDRIILGTTSKLSTVYTSATSELDKMIPIGSNIFNYDGTIELCSYHTEEIKSYNASDLNIKEEDINTYKKDAHYLMIAANFKTNLKAEQKQGNGNYGMRVVVNYYNEDIKDYQRSYLLDVNKMLGQPYNSTEGTRQYLFFPTDGNDLVSIDKVEFFCVNFPKQDNSVLENDIFISDLEFYFTSMLSDDEVAGAALRLITPDGSYISEEENDKRLQAVLKIRGANVQSTKDIEYYWFRQDLTIDIDNQLYSPLAGAGWYCLNERLSDSQSLKTPDESSLIQYIPGSKEIILNDNNCIFYRNIFKCVAIVDDVIITDQIVILNKKNNNIFTIKGSEENSFRFKGTSELTLSAYQGDTLIDDNEYFCYWAEVADGGNLQILDIEERSVIVVNPNVAERTVTYYLSVVRKGTGINLGSAEIVFVDATPQADYSLILSNADETFKYSLDGISPTNQQTDPKNRVAIQPINFTVYDKNGRDIAPTAAEKVSLFEIRWYWPVENTMIIPNFVKDYSKIETINGVDYFYFNVVNDGQVPFTYSIEDRYDINKSNNTIFLKVKFRGQELITSTNLAFIKEGEQGTNGTKYVCRIEPFESEVKQVFGFNDSILYETYNGDIDLFKNDDYFNASFVIKAYEGGESISPDSGTDTNHWKIIPNKANKNFTITDGGKLDRTGYENAQASIIQNYVTIDKLKCYASYPIPLVITADSNVCYVIEGGWNEAVYESNGERASYDTSRGFTVKKYVKQDNKWVKINFTDEVDYEWSWSTEEGESSSADEEYFIKPPKRLISDENNYITITIDENNYIYYPVHLYYNRYSMAAMNDWDGDNLQIEDNSILAAQIAAGKKNNDNSFTGIAIGETFQNGSSKDIGLFGYNAGTRTIFLNAEDGSARFGASGSYLDIDPSNGVVLQSSNFSTSSGTGMKIDMTTPSITYGSGNFKVDSNGYLTAKGGGSIAGWTIGDSAIYRNSASWGASNGMYFGSSGISITDKFKVGSNGTFTFGSGNNYISYNGSTITFGSGVTLSWSNNISGKPTIPTDVNQLSDASGQKWSTSVGDSWIRTCSVTCQNLVVDAAKITGTLSANKIYGGTISSSDFESISGSNRMFLNGARIAFTYNGSNRGLIYGSSSDLLIASTSTDIDIEAGADLYLEASNNVLSETIRKNTSDTAADVWIGNSTGQMGRVSSSSKRYKHDITSDIKSQLDPHKILNIPIRQFKFNEGYLSKESEHIGEDVIGFIAEEVNEYYPIAAVKSDDKKNIENWNFRYMIPPMLALIQEHHKEIEQLKAEIKQLKGEK